MPRGGGWDMKARIMRRVASEAAGGPSTSAASGGNGGSGMAKVGVEKVQRAEIGARCLDGKRKCSGMRRDEQGARRNGATHRAETKRHLIFKCQSRPWQPSLRRAALLTPALHPKTPHHQLQRRQYLHQNSTSRRSRSGLWRCSSAMYVSCGMVVALATIHSPAGGYWAAGSSFIGRLVLLSTGEATGVGDDQGGSGGAAARRRSFGGAS